MASILEELRKKKEQAESVLSKGVSSITDALRSGAQSYGSSTTPKPVQSTVKPIVTNQQSRLPAQNKPASVLQVLQSAKKGYEQGVQQAKKEDVVGKIKDAATKIKNAYLEGGKQASAGYQKQAGTENDLLVRAIGDDNAPERLRSLGVGMARSIPRSIVGAYKGGKEAIQQEIFSEGPLTIRGGNTQQTKPSAPYQAPPNSVQSFLLGDEPVKSWREYIPEEYARAQSGIQKGISELPEGSLIKKVLEPVSGPLSSAGGAVWAGLAMSDLFVSPKKLLQSGLEQMAKQGIDKTITHVARSQAPELIEGSLRAFGVAEDAIPTAAANLSKITDRKQVIKAIADLPKNPDIVPKLDISKAKTISREFAEDMAKLDTLLPAEREALERLNSQMFGKKAKEVSEEAYTIKAKQVMADAREKAERGVGLTAKAPKNKFEKEALQIAPEKEVLTTEKVLLRDSMRTQQRAARAAYITGSKDIKAQLDNFYSNAIDAVKRKGELAGGKAVILERSRMQGKLDKAADKANSEMEIVAQRAQRKMDVAKEQATQIQSIKSQIADFARATLPKAARGSYLTAVKNAKTHKDLTRAYARIEQDAANIAKKNIIGEMKRELDRVNSLSTIDVTYKRLVNDLFKDVDFTKRTEGFKQKYSAIREDIERRLKLGEDVEIERDVINRLAMLDKKPLRDMDFDELQDLQEQMRQIRGLGEVAQKSKGERYAAEAAMRTNEIIMASGKPIKSQGFFVNKGINKSGLERWIDGLKKDFIGKRNKAARMKVGLTPTDWLFDHLGLRSMKRVFDGGYNRYLTKVNKVNDTFDKNIKRLGINEASKHRIGMYAAMQQDGGYNNLLASGLDEDFLDNLVLTPQEMEMYNLIRKDFDEIYPAVAKVRADVWNEELGYQRNYVSMHKDSEGMAQLDISKRFVGKETNKFLKNPDQGSTPVRFKTKKTADSFTKARQEGAVHPIETNIETIFKRHMADAHYMVEMSKDIKQYSEIMAGAEMGLKLGDLGQRAALQWLNLLARRGGVPPEQAIKAIDKMRAISTAYTLAFNPQTMLMQSTALLDAVGRLGEIPVARAGAQIASSQAARDFMWKNFPKIREGFDTPSLIDDFIQGKSGVLEAARHAGFKPMGLWDAAARETTGLAAYTESLAKRGKKLDFNNPDPEAILDAQELINKTQSSTNFMDKALSMSVGGEFGLTGNLSVDRALTQYMTFGLNKFANLNHSFTEEMLKGKVIKGGKNLFWAGLVGAATGLAVKEGWGNLKAQMFGLTEAQAEGKYEDKTLLDKYKDEVLAQIPWQSSLAMMVNTGKNPVAILNSINKMTDSISRIANPSERELTAREYVNIAEPFAIVIPGGAQTIDILKRIAYQHDVKESGATVEQRQSLSAIKKENKKVDESVEAAAKDLLERSKTMSKEETSAAIQELATNNIDALKEFTRLKKKEVRGLTDFESELDSMDSDVLAKFVYKQITDKTIPKEERSAWVANLIKKRIVTTKTLQQVAELRKKK